MEHSNIFSENEKHDNFSWNRLGDIKEGRGDLGEEMPVVVYRLMQYTMLDILSREYGFSTLNINQSQEKSHGD